MFYDMRGQKLYEPTRPLDKPDRVALQWHNESVFLG